MYSSVMTCQLTPDNESDLWDTHTHTIYFQFPSSFIRFFHLSISLLVILPSLCILSDYLSVKMTDPCLHFRVCVLSGGPGSGKSLQCERMEERFGLRRVTLGELLCTELQSQSDRGRHLRDILERGEQLPEVSVTLLSKNINYTELSNTFMSWPYCNCCIKKHYTTNVVE